MISTVGLDGGGDEVELALEDRVGPVEVDGGPDHEVGVRLLDRLKDSIGREKAGGREVAVRVASKEKRGAGKWLLLQGCQVAVGAVETDPGRELRDVEDVGRDLCLGGSAWRGQRDEGGAVSIDLLRGEKEGPRATHS